MRSVVSLGLILFFAVSCDKVREDFRPDPVEVREEPASSKFPDRTVFETSNFGCTVRLWMPSEQSQPKRSLHWEDACPSSEQTLASLALLLNATFKRDPVSRFETLRTCATGLRSGWSERMALASVASTAWLKAAKKRSNPSVFSERYVDLFNRGDLGRGLSDLFARHSAGLSLASVDRVFTSTAKLLPFAKRHPSLSTSKSKVLMDASCWTFLVIPQGAS